VKPTRIGILFCLLLVPSCLFPQNRYDLSQFGNETADFIKQPLEWKSSDWLRLGLAGASTFLAMQIDEPVRDALMKDLDYRKSAPVEFGRLWGETYVTVLVAGGFALHGALAQDNSTKKVGFEVVQAALYAGGITTVLKAALGRSRPFTERGAFNLRPFTILDDDFHSLPSGHTALAFALSTVLSRNADSRTLKIIAFLPAALTAFSRVYQDFHWTSDCLLGGIIGYAVATWVVDQHDRKDSPVRITSVYPLTIRIVLN
jgi:hypothetical protein